MYEERLSCVFGGIKSMSTSTRTGVRRSAVLWVRSYTADAFEVACGDVGRPFS